MPRLSKRLVLALAVVAVYAVFVGVWAARPLSDSVPVGMDYSQTVLKPPGPQRLVSQEVECNSLFESAARDDTPLPELTTQPKGVDPLDYQREPCVLVHRNARILFAIDIVAVLVAVAGLVLLSRRLRRADPLPTLA
ncbi:MAG: hypothetical protein U0Q03_18465 [Acidimicrobiales bacterium]